MLAAITNQSFAPSYHDMFRPLLAFAQVFPPAGVGNIGENQLKGNLCERPNEDYNLLLDCGQHSGSLENKKGTEWCLCF